MDDRLKNISAYGMGATESKTITITGINTSKPNDNRYIPIPNMSVRTIKKYTKKSNQIENDIHIRRKPLNNIKHVAVRLVGEISAWGSAAEIYIY